MKVDIEDVLFWMDAIRNSDDRYRTLESFWKGQVRSKIWLIERLEACVDLDNFHDIVIHGGWNGVLASLLFNSNLKINSIISVDIDPSCKDTANTVNKKQEILGKFCAETADMAHYKYTNTPTVVINTSTEHVTDEKLQEWFLNIPNSSLIVLQSNNYFELDEHINCVKSVEELGKKLPMAILDQSVFETPLYDRFTVIGHKQ